MKNYFYNGKQFQFEDGDVPMGAVPADEHFKKTVTPEKEETVEEKSAAPANKAKAPKGNKK